MPNENNFDRAKLLSYILTRIVPTIMSDDSFRCSKKLDKVMYPAGRLKQGLNYRDVKPRPGKGSNLGAEPV